MLKSDTQTRYGKVLNVKKKYHVFTLAGIPNVAPSPGLAEAGHIVNH